MRVKDSNLKLNETAVTSSSLSTHWQRIPRFHIREGSVTLLTLDSESALRVMSAKCITHCHVIGSRNSRFSVILYAPQTMNQNRHESKNNC